MNYDDMVKVAAVVYTAAEDYADSGMGALFLLVRYFPEIEPIAKRIYELELKSIYLVEYEVFKRGFTGYDEIEVFMKDIISADKHEVNH